MADQAKLDGDQAFKNGDFQQAVNFYTSALEQNAINGTNPKHTLLSNRSASYCSLKMYDKALEDAVACIACNPSFAKGYSRKAAALCGKGDVDGAILAYKKVLSLDSTNEAAKKELSRLETEKTKRTPSRPAGGWSSEDVGRQSTKSSDSSSRKWWILNLILVVAQIFSIVHAILVVFITDHYESKNAFGRAILAALFSFTGQAILNYGFPSFSTGKKLWKAFRGKASPTEVKDIANFAMDNNTHNIFYCSLILSAAPSLLLLIPLFFENAILVSRRAVQLTSSVPAWAFALKTAVSVCADKVLGRESDIRRMISNAEVLIFFALILELFTSRRNILLLILYGQLLRVRYIVNADSKLAWNTVASRADSVFLHANSPSLVKTAYNKVKSLAAGLVSQGSNQS